MSSHTCPLSKPGSESGCPPVLHLPESRAWNVNVWGIDPVPGTEITADRRSDRMNRADLTVHPLIFEKGTCGADCPAPGFQPPLAPGYTMQVIAGEIGSGNPFSLTVQNPAVPEDIDASCIEPSHQIFAPRPMDTLVPCAAHPAQLACVLLTGVRHSFPAESHGCLTRKNCLRKSID